MFSFFIDSCFCFQDIIRLMKNKVLIYGRFLVACAVFVLCVLAFEGKFYLPKMFDLQFVCALQSGLIFGLSLGLFLLLGLILLSFVFGRIYCSTLCPLGIYQELLMFLFKPFYKKRKNKPVKTSGFVYFFAAVLFGFLFGGTAVLIRLFDPYAITGMAISGVWFGLGFVAALTVLVFFKKRFFCTNICPVGAVLGLVSRFSLFKIRFNCERCTKCGLCAKVCPCDAIDVKNQTVDSKTCIGCFKCLGQCKYDGIYEGLPQVQKIAFNPKRRELIKTGLVLAVFGAAFKGGIDLSKAVAKKVKNVILPAGAKSAEAFANRCLNCNLCVKNCPQKIIKPATADVRFVHIDYGNSYCNFKCHNCSKVCPSGAIEHISLAQKQKTKIGTAVINEDVCIKCGACSFDCPRHSIIKKRGMFPIVRFEQCIGCGKCATVCPARAITIEPVKKQVVLS